MKGIVKIDRFRFVHSLLLFVLVFVAVGEQDSNYMLPFVTMSAVAKYTVILFLIICFFVSIRKYTINKVFLIVLSCFVIRGLIELMHLTTYGSVDADIKYCFTIVASFLVFLFYTQIDQGKNEYVMMSLILTVLIISIQSIITFFLVFAKQGTFWGLKDQLHLAIGSSNFVECWLLMLSAFVFYSKSTKDYKSLFLYIVGFLGALCTRSKIAVLFWGVWLVFIIIRYYFSFSLKNFFLLVSFFLLIYFVYSYLDRINFFEYSSITITRLFSGNLRDRELAFNGRIQIYKNILTNTFDNKWNIIWGTGKSYTKSYGQAHNYIVEAIATGGFLGLFLIAVQYCSVCYALFLNLKNSFCKAALIMIVFVFINSMYEPCLDEFCFNIVYWMIIAVGLNNTKGVTA